MVLCFEKKLEKPFAFFQESKKTYLFGRLDTHVKRVPFLHVVKGACKGLWKGRGETATKTQQRVAHFQDSEKTEISQLLGQKWTNFHPVAGKAPRRARGSAATRAPAPQRTHLCVRKFHKRILSNQTTTCAANSPVSDIHTSAPFAVSHFLRHILTFGSLEKKVAKRV